MTANPTTTPTAPQTIGVLADRALRRVVAVLCVGQIISWGILYYALPVLSTTIAGDTGWSSDQIAAAFSLGLIINAFAGIATGRAIDRWGPRLVMTTGSALAVPALCAVALAPTYPLFLAAWALTGLAMSAVLYAPSFAAVTGWAGPDTGRRVRALTAITLIGGLASTAFAPLTAALAAPLGWRGTYLVLALILGLVTIPAHALGLAQPWNPPRSPRQPPREARGTRARSSPSRQPAFWVMAAAFTLAGFTVYASVVDLVPLLAEHGISVGAASVVLGIGGAGQVAGRLFWAPAAVRSTLLMRTVVVFGLVGLTTAAFAVMPGPLAILAVVSFASGMARGVLTLLEAVAVSDRWGATDYGRLNGLLTAPVMIASAVAPFAGAVLAVALGSYALAFAVMAATAFAAAILAPFTITRTQPTATADTATAQLR